MSQHRKGREHSAVSFPARAGQRGRYPLWPHLCGVTFGGTAAVSSEGTHRHPLWRHAAQSNMRSKTLSFTGSFLAPKHTRVGVCSLIG